MTSTLSTTTALSTGTALVLPKINPLECGGDMMKQIEQYMTSLGDSLGQINHQMSMLKNPFKAISTTTNSTASNSTASNSTATIYSIETSIVNNPMIQTLLDSVDEIEKQFNKILDLLTTDPTPKIKNFAQKMRYRARELTNDIDVFFQKKIIEAAASLLQFLGIPNPLNLPIPIIGEAEIPDENGKLVSYQPKIIDLFSKKGKLKIKAVIAAKYEKLKTFFTGDPQIDAYTGEWTLNSPEHAAEEIWHKIQEKVNEFLNNFIISLINTLYDILSKIPGLGLLVSFVDPTVGFEENLKLIYEKAKKKFKEIGDKIKNAKNTKDDDKNTKDDDKNTKDDAKKLTKEAEAALVKEARAIFEGFINSILNFPLPLFGSVGALLDIDIEKELKRLKTFNLETTMAKAKSGFKNLIEKIKRFFATGWIKVMYDLIMKLPGFILKQFPILGKIITWVETIIDIITGKVDACQVIKILLPDLFSLDKIITAVIPREIPIKFTEYGYLPPDVS